MKIVTKSAGNFADELHIRNPLQHPLNGGHMQTRLPDLSATHLQIVSLCGYVSAGTLAPIVAQRFDCKVLLGDAEHRLGLQIDLPNEDGETHVHLDFGLCEFLEEEDLPEEFGTIEQLDGAISALFGCSGRLFITATYEVALDSLPNGGLVKSLADVSAPIGEFKVSLTGGELTVKGNGPYRMVTWSQSNGLLLGKVRAEQTFAMSENYIGDAISLMESGVRQFVIEKELLR